MKEITIQVTDELVQEIGNAIAAYGEVLFAVSLGLSPPNKLEEELINCSDKELRRKMEILREFYEQL